MTSMQMYWIVILDSVVVASAVLTTVFGLLAAAVMSYVAETRDYKATPLFGIVGVMALLMALIWTFTPSTKRMAAIIVVPKIVNNEKVQNVGNKLYDLAVEWMDELKPKKERR